MDEEQAREVAHRILEEFEDLLTEKGIVIPSDDRTGDPDEARLFGRERAQLEASIIGLLVAASPNAKAAAATAEDDWPVREVAIRIVDEFEELLAEKDIMVPSKDRQGGEEEACLYGAEYYALEDGVVEILIDEVGRQAGSPACDGVV